MATETELERLVLRLMTDAEGYLGPLQEAISASENAAKEVENAGKRIEQIGDELQGYGKKLSLYVTAPLMALGGVATAAFAKQESEEIKLRGILEANGRAVQSLFADYAQYASALQRVTTVGDETTLGMLRTAEAFGVTGEQAKTAIKESMGLAAAVGMSERAAIRYTAMLAQGDTIMLQRYIPTLRMIEDQSERVAEAHRMLARMFAVAEAEAQSFGGQLKQLWNATGDLMEQIGAAVAKYLKPLVTALKQAVLVFQSLPGPVKEIIVLVAAWAASLGVLALAAGIATKAVGALYAKLIAGSIGAGLAAGPAGWIVLGIAAVSAAAIAVGAVLYNLQQQLGLFDPIIAVVRDAWERLTGELTTAWQQVQGDLLPVLQELGREVGQVLTDAAVIAAETLRAVLAVAIERITLALKIATPLVREYGKQLKIMAGVFSAASGWGGLSGGLQMLGQGERGAGITPELGQAFVSTELQQEIERQEQLRDAFDEIVQKLADQAITFSMTAREAALYRAEQQGLNEYQLAAIDIGLKQIENLEAQKKAIEEARKAEEQWAREQERLRLAPWNEAGYWEPMTEAFQATNQQIDRARGLMEQYMTPVERYEKTMAELAQYRELMGAEFEATYGRAAAAAQARLAGAGAAASPEVQMRQAVAFGSAEAQARLQEYREGFRQEKIQEKMLGRLNKLVELEEEKKDKPQINLQPAGLT